MTDYA